MIGFTEFVAVNIKALIAQHDTASQLIKTELVYQEKTFVTLYFDSCENLIHKEGSFTEVNHLQKFGMDEQFIMDNVKLEINNVINKSVDMPYEFQIVPSSIKKKQSL